MMQKKNTQEKFEDLAKLVLEFQSYFFSTNLWLKQTLQHKQANLNSYLVIFFAKLTKIKGTHNLSKT